MFFSNYMLHYMYINYITLRVFQCVALKMWKAAAGQSVSVAVNDDADDWETDPDFEVPMQSTLLPPPV